ncbi:hypothetical protein ELE36_06630 [Pseudolysobacter antarcticus]|uniref:DUF1579 domain-containing protein n=1 Tax=Pseudolysobacter antarcticus TaxID=2511995 RepID=A0A411HHS6_9GAMM|nr:hypothetical protein [Pseudolysobacter antarcticus]QBB70065.1 hypothetical protein ELE36_06630 [Pseudolysobacter antarcticus]
MNRSCGFLLLLFLTGPIAAFAEPAADTTPAATNSGAPAMSSEASQFDFMLGEWQLEVHPKVSGLVAMIHGAPRLIGTWKASRSSDGLGIEDDMRIVDGSGNPLSSNHSRRVYDTARHLWKLSGKDTQNGRSSEASGQWLNGEMHLDGKFIDAEGTTLTRTRYYDISANSFHMLQDRSTDNGQTWDEAVLTIDAKRAATNTPP